MLTVYGRTSSFNLQKVMWLVGELRLAHRHVELGGAFGGLDTPEFLAKNPHGRVPVIEDDGEAVWESHRNSALSGGSLWPAAILDL
jgi:glutathione S-transferase